ncbi:hypothetical protein AAGG74_15155 [Bacillus mexicanus]
MVNYKKEKITFARKLGKFAGNLFNKRVNKVAGRHSSSIRQNKNSNNKK